MSKPRSIFSGEFGEILIPDLLTFLDMLGKTGTLELKRADVTKRIHWHQGEIIFADSSDPQESIGEYLVRNGWVEAADLAKARAKAKNPSHLVRHLIQGGALDPALLLKSERSLVLDIIYSIFEWKDGSFAFLLSGEPHSERVALRTSVSNIIMEGSRRLDEWARIRASFKSEEIYPHALASTSATLQLPPIELDVLAQADGRRTITEIIRAVEHDQFTVLNALLTLHAAGAIGLSDEPVTAAAVNGHGLAGDERVAAIEILEAFNNIFEDLLERVRRIKGDEGAERFDATLQQATFQRSPPFAGLAFLSSGRLPADAVIENLADMEPGERLSRLKGSLDRLLAKQVLMLDTSYPVAEKQAISELIAREKDRLVQIPLG